MAKSSRTLPNLTPKDIDRFNKKIAKADSDQCWEWQAAVMKKGYGMFNVNKIIYYAHRIAYQLHYGPPPIGPLVLHRCDNRICCNPSHLFLGTDKDNVADMIAKGRNNKDRSCYPRGSGSPVAKLDEKQVLDIRSRMLEAKRGTAGILATEYGVHLSLIHLIAKRKIWQHVS